MPPQFLDAADFDVVGPATGNVPPPPPGMQVLDAADFEVMPEEGAAPARPGGLESVLRGVKQGVTMGFGDEIAGALESAFSDKTYKQARDEARASDKAAQEAHPWLYGGGNLAGGAATMLIPGLNVAKGATLAASAGRAALAGGIAGLGGSDAEDLGGIVKDTAVGAALGGAAGAAGHGIGKWLAAAPGRAAEAEMAGLTTGVQNSTKVKVFGPRGANEAGIKAVLNKAPEIKKAINADTGKALAMVDDKLDDLGQRLGEIYTKVQKATPGSGVPLSKVEEALTGVAREYDSVATSGQRDAVEALLGKFAKRYGGEAPGGQVVPIKELHREVSQFAKQGFEGGPMFSVPVGKELKRNVSGVLRDLLQDHVDEIASSAQLEGVSRKILESTNAEYSAWRGVQTLLDQKVTRKAADSPTMRQMLGEVAKAVGQKADQHLVAPGVRLAPRATIPAIRQSLGTTAPALPANAAAALRSALGLNPDDEEALAGR